MSNTIDELQKELLIHLKKFDAACREYGIQYSIHGGTMLGAVRHKGFIPWDDDVDITMTSENYIRLKNVLDIALPEYWISDTTSPSPRLLKKSYENHPVVWIDILEYNYVSGNKLLQKLKINLLILLAGMCRTKDTIKNSTVKKHGLVKIILLYMVYCFGKLFPMRLKLKMHRYLSRKCFLGKKELIHRTNDQAKSIHYILPKHYMEEFVDMPFEDTFLMVCKSYEEILSIDYGKDYMTLPPKNKREVHDNVVRKVCENIQAKYERRNS